MELSDFKLANCSLLRTPSIEYSKLSQTVDDALARAWKSGTSIDQAVNNILQDQKVVNSIAKQLDESMKFQREQELKRVEQEAQERRERHMQVFQTQLDSVEKEIGVSVSQREQELEKIKASYANATQSYSAAQQSLEDMRSRVKSSLEQIGEKKYEQLIQLNDLLVADDSSGQKSDVRTSAPKETPLSVKPEVREVINVVKTSDVIDPLNKKPDVKYIDLNKKSEKGYVSRMLKKTWEVLNYDVWPRRKQQ